MRVGGDGGIGVKNSAWADAETVGMLGSGGMAHSNLMAFVEMRKIKRLNVFSPTKAHREAFAREAAETYGIEAKACSRPEEIYEGADIVAACTDSAVTVLDGTHIEKGAHVINIGGLAVPPDATPGPRRRHPRFG